MNTFDIGDIGERYVMHSIRRIYANPKMVPRDISKQIEWGDLVQGGCKHIANPPLKIEVKTEISDPSNNFFIERWSNKKTGREGWLKTSPADELYYLYLDAGYGFRFATWQQSAWIIDYNSGGYKLVEQKKNDQANDTWGYLVSHDSLKGHFAPIKFTLDPEQLEKAGYCKKAEAI